TRPKHVGWLVPRPRTSPLSRSLGPVLCTLHGGRQQRRCCLPHTQSLPNGIQPLANVAGFGMHWAKDLLIDGQGAVIESRRLVELALYRAQGGELSQHCRRVGMLWELALLANSQRSLKQGFSFCRQALRPVDHR